MPRGRPKGSKNKPKNENILPQIEEEVKPVSVVPEVVNEPSEFKKVNKEDGENGENKEEVVSKSTKQSKEIKDTKETKASKPKSQKDYPTCDLCGAECMCDRIKLNLTYLTGKATWHREVKQDLFYLCHDCGREMNKMIDDWLLEHGAERKFQSLEDVSSPVENLVDNVDIANKMDNVDNIGSAGDTDNSDFEF